MRSTVVVKRVLPFFLALTAGLFVASFFVEIVPRFNFRDYRVERCRELQQLRIQNDYLRQQNESLRDQIDMLRRSPTYLNHVPRDFNGGFELPSPPPPPAAPRYVR